MFRRNKTSVKTFSMDIFKLGTILIKELLKTSTIALPSEIISSVSMTISPWFDTAFFSIKVILDLACTLSVKRGFTFLQNVLLSVMSRVFSLLKKFFFCYLINVTQMLRCLLYALLSMSLLVFRNLFLRRLLFITSLLILLFIKSA